MSVIRLIIVLAFTGGCPAVSIICPLIVVLFIGGLTVGLLSCIWGGMPTFAVLNPGSALWVVAAVAYGIQWAAFIPANAYQTEKYYDLTGSITYLSCTLISLYLGQKGTNNPISVRSLVQSSMVVVWCTRLGYFLFTRISKDRKDGRFDEIKINPPRFLAAWTIQGTWVLLTALPVFTVNVFCSQKELGLVDFAGWMVWGLGFTIEIVSDNQKSAFAADSKNRGKYINEGLWFYSRHPNYFGEITLWFGQFIAASSTFTDGQWINVVSPLFVIFLLMKVSGVPMLEQRSDEKFGGDQGYEAYKKNTSVLIPWCKGGAAEEEDMGGAYHAAP